MTELNNLLENIQNIQKDIANALLEKGQMVTNFADYPNAVENISVKNTVKLFSSVEEMEQDPNPVLRNLAIVYNNGFIGLYIYNGSNYIIAPTQLTAISDSAYNGNVFYGLNGTTIGSLQTNTNLNIEQVRIRTNLYHNLGYLSSDSLVNCSKLFEHWNNIYTVPNLDTSNTIDMIEMLQNCQSLQNIPNFNTSKVINMQGMFYNGWNLTSVPNFDMGNVLNMQGMLGNCYKLKEVPNFDTSRVINMRNAFGRCYNLINIPQLNTSNVTNITILVQYCNNLSNTTIQNIINMCLNSNVTKIAYKNLSVLNGNSPLYKTKFDSSYYSNRLTELDEAGWTY